MPRPTDTGETRVVVAIRLSPTERAELERVQRERGDESLSATIRVLPELWDALQTRARGARTK